MTEEAQRTAAGIAGFLYLFLMATGVFAELYARGSLIVPGNAAATAANIAASERLFRLGTVSDLITFAGDAILVWALYVVLKPVNRNVATFDTQQLQALARVFIGVQADGYRIGIEFFGLGSAVFGYLWLQSRYIPRGLAVLGVVGSLVAVVVVSFALGIWLIVKGI